MNTKHSIGERLLELREALGETQAEFAKRYSCASYAAYRNYENGSSWPPVQLLIAIAADCDISLEWLILGVRAEKRTQEKSEAESGDAFDRLEIVRRNLFIDSQVEFAERLGLKSRQQYHQIKQRGAVPRNVRKLLRENFGIDPGWILSGKGGMYLIDNMSRDSLIRTIASLQARLIEEMDRSGKAGKTGKAR